MSGVWLFVFPDRVWFFALNFKSQGNETKELFPKAIYDPHFCWSNEFLSKIISALWEVKLWPKRLSFLHGLHTFNPITYGILTFRQLWEGGGLFGPDPENKVTVNRLIWNLVLIMVWMILVNMQNFKLMAFLLLEIWRHKISFPIWNESSPFDIYPLDSIKTRQKSLFMPENIFLWINLYPLLHFHGFEAKQKTSYAQFFKTSHFKNNCSNPPGESILLKFRQNESNR